MSCVDVTLPPQGNQPKPIKLVVGVALIDADGRVLIAERPPGKRMAGFWEFPGGHIEEGETPEVAAVRELKEELGVVTSVGCLSPGGFASHNYEAFHLVMPLFICRVWQGTAQGIEGQKLAWVKPAELRQYNLLPADVPLIPVLENL